MRIKKWLDEQGIDWLGVVIMIVFFVTLVIFR